MPRHAARLAEVIASDFYGGQLDLSVRGVRPPEGTWAGMPEVRDVARLRERGANDWQVRLFVTFLAAMDRARDANTLWNNGARLFGAHPELFVPVEVAAMSIHSLRAQLSAFGVSQRHGTDSQAWQAIARSLASGRGPVARAVATGVGDARELIRDLGTESAGKARYPLLRGPKIGLMWIRMLAAPAGASIANVDTIPVPVDVQVRRATRYVGVADPPGGDIDSSVKGVIQEAWRNAVTLANIGGPSGIADTCAALDPALWAFGKYGCSHCERVGRRVPVSRACESCRFQP